MKYVIKLYTALSLLFLLLLSISGSIGGIFSDVIYVMAFVAPAACGLYFSQTLHRKREEEAGITLENKWYYTLRINSVNLFLPLVMPVILAVMLVSYMTTLLLGVFGLSNPEVQISSLPNMILVHALIPTFFEELLFRYVPLRLILPYSKSACVIISSLYFACIHCSLFAIPYALVAGAVFIIIDIAFDSVLPSLILHFLNNAMSVIMLKYCTSDTSYGVYFGVCGVILLISVLFIHKYRAEYKSLFKGLNSTREAVDTGYYPLLLIIPTVLVAIMNLF